MKTKLINGVLFVYGPNMHEVYVNQMEERQNEQRATIQPCNKQSIKQENQ